MLTKCLMLRIGVRKGLVLLAVGALVLVALVHNGIAVSRVMAARGGDETDPWERMRSAERSNAPEPSPPRGAAPPAATARGAYDDDGDADARRIEALEAELAMLKRSRAELAMLEAEPAAVKGHKNPPARPAPAPEEIPPEGDARAQWFHDELKEQQKHLALPLWYDQCVSATPPWGKGFRFRPRNDTRRTPYDVRDEQIFHVLCVLERRLALGEDLHRPLEALQIGANDGDDAFFAALVWAATHYDEFGLHATLVEPTIPNFKRLVRHYVGSPELKGKATYVNGAVCSDCCDADGTVPIYHPRWSLLQEWEDTARARPDLHPNAFKTPDGSWRQKWLYELNSLDPDNLKSHFRNSSDIESTRIKCSAASDLVASPDLDYVMIDVEGVDYQVLASLDLRKHRPLIIIFESKVMEDYTPGNLWKAAAFCVDHGYFVVRATFRPTNYVCVRTDADDVPLRDVAPGQVPRIPPP